MSDKQIEHAIIQEQRNLELREYVKEPRSISVRDFSLVVDPDVFPPDVGYTSSLMADAVGNFAATSALDVGTGTLFLALVCRQCGVPIVWASDVHPPAVSCARKNLDLNPSLKPIEIFESDLFSQIPPSAVFDLILFNHPFYPIYGEPVAGLGRDGGKEILQRFFTQLPRHLSKGGHVLMSSSSIADLDHRPSAVARAFGLKETIIAAKQIGGFEHAVLSYER